MNNKECYRLQKVFRDLLEVEFNDLEKYILASLKALQANEVTWEERYLHLKANDKTAETLSGSDSADLVFQYLHTSPYIVRHSLFISVYSFLEFSLKKLCEVIVCPFPQFRRRVVNMEKTYQLYAFLMDDLMLDKQTTGEEWKMLNIFRDIRNSILHHNSTIGKNISTATYEYLRQDSRILFEEPKGFRIKDEGIIMELISVSRRFLFTILNQYELKYPEQAGKDL